MAKKKSEDWSKCLPLANDRITDDKWDAMFACLREKTVEVSSNGNKHNIYLSPDNAVVKPPGVKGWFVEFIIDGVHEPVSAGGSGYQEWGRFLYDCYVHKGEEFVAAWRNVLLSENNTFISRIEQRWSILRNGWVVGTGLITETTKDTMAILLYELEIILRVGGPELAVVIILNSGNDRMSEAAKAWLRAQDG